MEGTENTQWIEDYLDGVLSEPDLKRFEEKLLSDPDFEKEVNAQRMVRESFERAELKEFFKKIDESTKEVVPAANLPFPFSKKEIATSLDKTQQKEFDNEVIDGTEEDRPAADKSPFSFGILAIAASVILAVGISLYFLFKETTQDLGQKELVADAFKIEVNSSQKNFKSEDPREQVDLKLRTENGEIEIQIVKSEIFKNHYSFNKGILKLYQGKSTISKDQIKIYYDPFADIPYEIEIQGRIYSIEENSGAAPKPLTQFQK